MANKEKFDIFIDQKKYDWEEPTITGTQIKHLAGVPQSYRVWQDLPGPNDPPVKDDQHVDLRAPGKEKFFTGQNDSTEGSEEQCKDRF